MPKKKERKWFLRSERKDSIVRTFADFTQPFEIVNIKLRRHVLQSIYNPRRSTRSDKGLAEEKKDERWMSRFVNQFVVRRVSTKTRRPMTCQRFSSRKKTQLRRTFSFCFMRDIHLYSIWNLRKIFSSFERWRHLKSPETSSQYR